MNARQAPGPSPAPGSSLPGEVQRAAQVLRDGGLIALPTETVYGLGADADNPAAVARIFAAKQRPADHPLIVHLHAARQISQWARELPHVAWQLAEAFWPGPLTLIVKRSTQASDAVTGGLDTVALRVPDHPLALAVLQAFGGGVAAPSANRHGRVSPTAAAHVHAELGGAVDLVLDGGPCAIGIESTIVDLSTGAPRVLRPGAISAEDLQHATGTPVTAGAAAGTRCPGVMRSHYAPRATVLMVAADAALAAVDAWCSLGARVGLLSAQRPGRLPAAALWLELGEGDREQAQQLYRRLREADERALDVLVVVPPEDAGLGHALRDRIRRAAGLGDAHPPPAAAPLAEHAQ